MVMMMIKNKEGDRNSNSDREEEAEEKEEGEEEGGGERENPILFGQVPMGVILLLPNTCPQTICIASVTVFQEETLSSSASRK